jgi:hypothetical protein
LHRVVAAKAPDRFFHYNAHGTPWLDWRDDPKQQRLIVSDDRMVAERPLDRFFVESRPRPDAPLPGTASNELVLTGLGWWPLARRPSPTKLDNLPIALSAVARSPAYQARPQLEQVGGRWCHVLEYPGRDQLWLDVDRGCAVVARQLSYPGLARVHRIEFSDFRELLPGVWAPFRLRNLHYERGPDGAAGKVILDATLTVLRIRLNDDVDDARFRFEPRPGSTGRTDGQPLRQTVAGGEEYLDEVVDWIRRYNPEAQAPTNRTGWPNPVDVVLGAVFAAVAVAALFWWPRWAPRRGGGP